MIDYINIISKFSSIYRFSGSFLFKNESVPDHSVEMALLCINFSKLVPESDKKEMCYRCIIHDLEESITSDVPRPLKYSSNKLKELIDDTAKNLLSKYCSEELVTEVFNSKSMDNINGFLVHLADRIQCYLKIKREVEQFGNKSLLTDLNNLSYLPNDLINEITDINLMTENSKSRLINYIEKLFYKINFTN